MAAPAGRGTASPGVLRTLGYLSILELVSIGALLLNLATVHLRPVAAILGPTHGALYLCVAATALMARGLLPRTRALALVPVLGGAFTLVNIRAERRRLGAAPYPAQ
ncbi:hypothetical protein [Mycolicibacterium sp.]|uniref:hypothetical protein n=1 Tax=Mycolicibacterium sp. TaxID=2320850 RepID=UPI003D0E2FD3